MKQQLNEIHRMQQLAGIIPLNEITINDYSNGDLSPLLKIYIKVLFPLYKLELIPYIDENTIIKIIQSINNYLKNPNTDNWNLCHKYTNILPDIYMDIAIYDEDKDQYTENIFNILHVLYEISNLAHLKYSENINKSKKLNSIKNKIKELINVKSNQNTISN